MAIIYELWAECKDEISLQKLKTHFDGLEHTLLTGSTVRFRADIESPYSEAQGICVWSPQICPNGRGVENLKDSLEATEAGMFLYYHLKSAPDFRFAHIGWNAENITTVDLSDFFETTTDGKTQTNLYCVLDDELYKQLGSPVFFWKFREGYWWRKFRGVNYEPLFSADQKELRKLCQQLLPENFFY